MKIKATILLLLAPMYGYAEPLSPYEYLPLNNATEYVKMRNIILDQHMALHNLRNATEDTTKWKDKELRIKALDCDIQELKEITSRIMKKYKKQHPKDNFIRKEDLKQNEEDLKENYIFDCKSIQAEDSKVNWDIEAIYYYDR